MSRRGLSRAVVASFALLVVTGAAVSLAETPSSEPGAPTFQPPRAEPPVTDAMREELAQRRTEYEAAKIRRGSSEAREERERSRTAHRGLGRDAALALGERELPGVFSRPWFDAAKLPAGARVKRFVGETGALIEGMEEPRLIESMGMPLTSTVGSGERDFVDLQLRPTAGGFEPHNPVVPLRITSDGAAVLPDAETRIHLDGAQALGEPVVRDGRAFFANALSDTDLVVAPVPSGVSVSFQVRSADAPEQAVLAVDLPAGKAMRLRTDARGDRVEVVDADGEVAARVLPPSGWDTDGESLPVGYELDGKRIIVRFPHRDRDLRYPLFVDPIYENYAPWYGDGSWAEWGFYANANVWWAGAATGQPMWMSNRHNPSVYYYQDEYASMSWRNTRGYIASLEGYGVTHDASQITCAYMGTLASGWAYWKGAWSTCSSVTDQAPRQTNSNTTPDDWAMFQFKMAVSGVRWSGAGQLRTYGAIIGLEDTQSPALSATTNVPNSTNGAWVGPNTSVTVSPRAKDSGLGMRAFNLYDAGTSTSWAPTSWVRPDGSATNNLNEACTGLRGARCVNDREVSGAVTFNTSDLSQDGERTITGGAFDALGKQSTYTTVVKADTSGPNVSYSGELSRLNGASIPPGIYQLGITTSDDWSQVTSVQMQVDSGAGWTSVAGPTSLFGAYGWNFDARQYARPDVERLVKVRALATDSFGNSSAPEISVRIQASRGDVITDANATTHLYAYGIGDFRQGSAVLGSRGMADLQSHPSDVYAGLKANQIGFVRIRFNAADCGSVSSSTGCLEQSVINTFDPVVRAAADRRLQIQPVLSDISGDLALVPDSSKRRGYFAAWARRLAARYGPGGAFWQAYSGLDLPILSWEIWNEPNSTSPAHSGPTGFPESSFADLLYRSKTEIRAVQPQARIVFGGLATGGVGSALPFMNYLHNVIGAGVDARRPSPLFDAVGVHPYAATPAEGHSKVGNVRTVLNLWTQPNHANVEIWPNEIGWAVDHEGTAGDDSPYTVFANEPPAPTFEQREAERESKQANNLISLLEKLRGDRDAWKIGPIAWFSLRDDDRPAGQINHWGYRSGLVNLSYSGSSLWDGVNRAAFHEMRTRGFNASALPLPPKH